MKRSLCFAIVGFVVFTCLSVSADAGLLVYEPFDYPDGLLNGQGGALGTTGTWTTNDTGFAEGWWCHPEGELTGQFDDIGGGLNMFDGTVDNLATSGGFVGSAGPEEQGSAFGTRDPTGNMDANIGLDPSVTATFQSGTTTWFSYVGAHADNRNQGSPTFMLCTDPTDNGARGLTMQNSGNGIGGVGGPPRFNLFDVYPHYFSGGVHHQTPGGYLGGVFGGHDGIVTAFCSTSTCDGVLDESGQPRTQTMAWQISDDNGFGAANIVVGKIEWDADTGGEDIISVVRFLETDELSEAAFDALITAVPALSSANWASNKPNLDQSQFDTLNISSLKFYVDEIRIATTFGDVIGVPSNAASNPNPTDEATDVPRDVSLSWTPGVFAAPVNGHKVYFGETFNDVNDATGGVAQTATSYTPPQRLDFGTTYYWRVDEVNAPPTSHIEFKGEVWSFTTEPVGYPIDANNITAIASSSDAGQGPENTVNRSGLDANDLHSTEMTDMWLSNSADANAAWIQYEFDKVYKLHQMWVWNHNTAFEVWVGFGFKDVTIEYSTNGTDWTVLAGVTEFARGTGLPDYAHNTPVDLDVVVAKYVKITANSNWSAGVTTQYGLSEVRFFYIPVQAREPSPEDEATGVGPDVALNWRAGREAATHDVYLSSKRTAVVNGTVPAIPVTEASYGPLSLDLGQTYYWKINEVNMAETPTTWEGDVWSFATPEYFVVEDFEDYNDFEPDRIFETWKGGYGYIGYCGNGTGSAVGHPSYPYAEQTIVHEGSQSMPVYYDNSATGTNSCGQPINLYYSETERTFDTPQDWTKAGARLLTLYFYGNPDNDAGATEQMYLKVNGAKVLYDGDMADIKDESWHEWNIGLASFGGVNLQNVTKVSIGLGSGTAPGGSGVLYFDDIRLYPSKCVLSRRSADFAKVDYVADCVVDYKELELMAENWLAAAPIMVPIPIDNPGFEDPVLADGVYDYSMDNEGWGYFANDGDQGPWNPGLPGTSDPGYGGNAPEGQNVGWANPLDGSVGVPGGLAQVLTNPNATLQADTTYTLTVEVGNTPGYPWHGYTVQLLAGGTAHTPGSGGDYTGEVTGGTLLAEDNNSLTIAVDTFETSTVTYTYNLEHASLLGEPLQIRLLTLGNVLAGDEYTEVDFDNVRLSRSIDLYEDNKTDFKDYAVLADHWLDEQLWP